MSILSYTELLELQHLGIITNSLPEQVNSASIDITLGLHLLVERRATHNAVRVVSLRNHEALSLKPVNFPVEESYVMQPGEFILAQSEQTFNLPNDLSCEYKLKSSMARLGLEHLTAGWCDAGWHGSVLTLELKNMTERHAIRIQPGDPIGQVVFFRHAPVPAEHAYGARGRYNNDRTVHGVKA